MTFTAVTLKTETHTNEADGKTAQRVYHVHTDDPDNDTVVDAETADDGTYAIPAKDDPFVTGDSAKATKIKADRNFRSQGRKRFKVTVDYSSKEQDQPLPDSPLDEPTQYDYQESEQEEPYFRDTDDNPVITSAGGDFQDLPQRAISRGTITITRNVASYNDVTAESYRNTINASQVSFNGSTYAEKTLRVTGYSASGPNERNGISYWRETITLAKNEAGWEHLFEDRDIAELLSGKRKPILDAKNEPVEKPYPLDGYGSAKASPTDTPATLTFKPYVAGTMPNLT